MTAKRLTFILLTLLVPVLTVRAEGEESLESMGCFCRGAVGNVNCDYADQVGIDDLQLLVDHLFNTFVRLPNPEEANCNGDPEGLIDIVDLQVLVDHLFLTFQPLPNCPGPPNHPPETRIIGQHGLRFINAEQPGSPVAGVRIAWAATDLIDHPYYPPPVQAEWRLYGPYDDSLMARIVDSFVVPVFITNDYRVFRFGQPPDTAWDTIVTEWEVRVIPRLVPPHLVVCDTSYVSGEQIIECDTMLIDTIQYDNDYGTLDTLFDLNAPDFVGKESTYNRLAAKSSDGLSSWVDNTRDTVYDVYADFPMDTTAEMNFIFWVRSRDPDDSTLYDPVPDFQMISVIEAKREREVLVIDVGQAEAINKADFDSTRAFWSNSINLWKSTALAEGDVFLPQRDFIRISDYQNDPDFLLLLMKYKVMVLLQDAVTSSVFGNQDTEVIQSLYDAMQFGLSTWLAMRTPLGGLFQGTGPIFLVPGLTYQQYFGVEQIRYSGWTYFARKTTPQLRVEDFVGALSQDFTKWPELTIDSTLLHRRYAWAEPYYQWVDTLGVLPGVGYCRPVPEAEVMYTYRSIYGEEHFLGEEYSYQGFPVMHRYNSGLARTVHSLFTPLALEADQAQALIESVLNWLCYGEDP